MPMSSFELRWQDRRVGANQTPVRFLDFVVDGRSLYERHGADFVAPLGWLAPDEDRRAADRLLRKAPPDVDDRVALYVCPECGDLDCGVISARIERDGDAIVWRDLAFSSAGEDGGWRHDTAGFADWPELRFEARAYWEAITDRPRREGAR